MRHATTAEKNLYIPDDLLAEIEELARAQGKSADEVAEQSLREAVELQKLLAAGHAHAKERGYKPSDVPRKIAEYRREKQDRSR